MLQEINKVEDGMKRHFSPQTSENNRLQQQIASLKVEKISFQNELTSLQKRISDLEMMIYNFENNKDIFLFNFVFAYCIYNEK